MDPVKYERIRKVATVCAWCYFFYMAYMLLSPAPVIPPPVRFFSCVVHVLAFVVLGFLVGVSRRRWTWNSWFVLLMVWGVGSEFLQRYTGRCFEWQDIIQNVCGITAGLFAAWVLRRFWFDLSNKGSKHD